MSASPRKNVASKGVERIDHYIDSLDPGIRLHLREKRPKGKKKFEDQATLLIVHGRMAPGPVAYDLPVPGYSWMDYIASRGFDVFALSIRGFGESTWPQEMHVSPRGKPPAIPGKVAVKDIKATVDFICEQRGVNKLSVLGRSWGTTTGPAYAADNMSHVHKLVLYAPYYAYDNPARLQNRWKTPENPGNSTRGEAPGPGVRKKTCTSDGGATYQGTLTINGANLGCSRRIFENSSAMTRRSQTQDARVSAGERLPGGFIRSGEEQASL